MDGTQLEARLDTVQELLTMLHEAPISDEGVQLAIATCEDAGFVALGVGARRLAVELSERRVAKLAWRRTGLGDNEVEWRIWESAQPALRALLAPTCRPTPGGVIIQGRCLPVAAETLANVQMLTRRLAGAGIADTRLNLGIYEGRVVCYDYAMLSTDRAQALFSEAVSSTARALDSGRP